MTPKTNTAIASLCPTCGYPSTAIIYGLPSYGLFERAAAGEVILGGCMIDDDSPEYRCTNPNETHDWGSISFG